VNKARGKSGPVCSFYFVFFTEGVSFVVIFMRCFVLLCSSQKVHHLFFSTRYFVVNSIMIYFKGLAFRS